MTGGEPPDSDSESRASADNFDVSYVAWESDQSHEQNAWFLYEAFHIFDSGIGIQKYAWSKIGARLIGQIRDVLSRDLFPIFASEGTGAGKYERVRHDDYLTKAYRSFGSIGGAPFIYGHSLAEDNDHYLKCIRKGKVSHLYVSLYSAPDLNTNKFIARRAAQLFDGWRAKSPLMITYSDAASTEVWDR